MADGVLKKGVDSGALTFIPNRDSLGMGTRKSLGLGEFGDLIQALLDALVPTPLIGFWVELRDVLHRRPQQSQRLLRVLVAAVVEAVKKFLADHVQGVEQNLQRLAGYVHGRLRGTGRLGVLSDGVLQFFANADVVHDQTTGFVFPDPVGAGDGLHQPVAFHGLVHVQGVYRRRIEAGEPPVSA